MTAAHTGSDRFLAGERILRFRGDGDAGARGVLLAGGRREGLARSSGSGAQRLARTRELHRDPRRAGGHRLGGPDLPDAIEIRASRAACSLPEGTCLRRDRYPLELEVDRPAVPRPRPSSFPCSRHRVRPALLVCNRVYPVPNRNWPSVGPHRRICDRELRGARS